MRGFPDYRSSSRLVLLALAIVALSTSARAQDDDIIEDDAPPVAVDRVMWTDENFDQWVFGGRNIPSIRSRLDSLLALKIEDANRVCKLTEDQKKKLTLAGKGDLKHFFDQVAEKKRRFQLLKNDQNRINEIFQEIQPLQLVLNSGPYDDGSIFAKTIPKTLDESQMALYQQVIHEKNQYRYRAKVELVVATLDQALGMKGDQRKQLVDLLLADTRVPSRYGQYDYYLVMYQMARIPESKLKPMFDDAQWKLLQNQFTQAQGMEQFLKQNGLLDAKNPDNEFRKPADVFVNPETNLGIPPVVREVF